MESTKKCPTHTIEAVSINKDNGCMKPIIEKAIQLEVQDSDVRCMKGDCTKDCPATYYGG